jgi:DNA-directed RNA polymerase subunit H (RpoH/RPB5)
MTYFENQEVITQTEIEKEKDVVTMEEELQVLGAIGFNNPKDPYIKFHDAISKVD